VMSTGEMLGRMVRSGMLGCPVCGKEYPIVRGRGAFLGEQGAGERDSPSHRPVPLPAPRSRSMPRPLQALLDLSGPGGYVLLLGSAAHHAVGLAELMGGIHFVGVKRTGRWWRSSRS